MLKAVGWVPLQGHSPPFSACSVPPTGRTPGGGSSGEEDWDPGPTAPIPWLHPHLPPGSSHPSLPWPLPHLPDTAAFGSRHPSRSVRDPAQTPGNKPAFMLSWIHPLLCASAGALAGAVLPTVTLVTRLLTIKIMKTKVSFNRQIDT